MLNIFNQIVDKWKQEIEAISIKIPGDNISRKVESIDFFSMKSKHYPHSEAWKVNFNFMDGIRGCDDDTKPPGTSYINHDAWAIELSRLFTNKFGQGKLGPNGGEIHFNNSKCEYMTYQGYRFIIQFYPDVFIEEIRNEKLEKLGI